MKSKETRQAFLDFFSKKEHRIVPSAPLVMKDDPTLMFTNAGMNQFKDCFLGYKKPTEVRVVNSQKCLRVSGKHNDLEEVGHDTYHHTMFEMLGNWSFGDYFKHQAIQWAWELLTEVYHIPIENIYVSYFAGDAEEGLLPDEGTKNIWKVLVSEDRILPFGKKDNFWEMGDTGPCGPCSEIHVDVRSEEEKQQSPGSSWVNKDHPQVIEIWNLVFMEFFRKADHSLEKLPSQHVDTGMGFERLCMVLQHKKSNYDTDVFMPIINEIEQVTNSKYGENKEIDIAIRVIADHLRAVVFAIVDGQLPSNNGAGYVIRRILRRAISYAYRFLNQQDPFIFKLVAVLKKEMGDYFEELNKQYDLAVNVIREEETAFLRTLDQGLNRISQIIKENKQIGSTVINGKKIFELYDTYGFPIDLSALVAQNYAMTIDVSGFEASMEKQKKRAREAAELQVGDWETTSHKDDVEEFIGYDYLEAEVKITRYRKVISKKETLYQLVFNLTPFYAGSGGQVGDTGWLKTHDQEIIIIDTKKESKRIIHFTRELPQNIEANFSVGVNKKRREAITKNHTATHLLHQALRDVLGNHVEQKGSYVSEDHFRFDFSHFGKLSIEELTQVEGIIFRNIIAGHSLEEDRAVPVNIAMKNGAIALFGEKYNDLVRTIKFGDSYELCGGCHVKSTSELIMISILSESSIASGVRRIEAISGERAIEQLKKHFADYSKILTMLKNPEDPIKTVISLKDENTKLKKEIENLLREKALRELAQWLDNVRRINGISFIAAKTKLDAAVIKDMLLRLKEKGSSILAVIASVTQDKPTISVFISEDLVRQNDLDAVQLVRHIGKYINGGGGGQVFFATAGGKNIEGIDQALEEAEKYLLNKSVV